MLGEDREVLRRRWVGEWRRGRLGWVGDGARAGFRRLFFSPSSWGDVTEVGFAAFTSALCFFFPLFLFPFHFLSLPPVEIAGCVRVYEGYEWASLRL